MATNAVEPIIEIVNNSYSSSNSSNSFERTSDAEIITGSNSTKDCKSQHRVIKYEEESAQEIIMDESPEIEPSGDAFETVAIVAHNNDIEEDRNDKCNNQRLNLDILSTISNQSEFDDGGQNIEQQQKPQQVQNIDLANKVPNPTRNDAVLPSSSASSSLLDSLTLGRDTVNDKKRVQLDDLLGPSCVSMSCSNTWDHETISVVALDSEEEICTCDAEDEEIGSSEDELPSRDVDLSGFTQSDPLAELSNRITETPKNYRKRKINECRSVVREIEDAEKLGAKRAVLDKTRSGVRLDTTYSPRSVFTPTTPSWAIMTPTSSTSSLCDKKTPRSVIPTKDNPPPELQEWLQQFQKWSNAERLLAVDQLIEQCEPTQVRHMMKVIEPQFQRDFISLLPKELALQVLSYLEPKDLLRAAQTCRNWRFLCDDNLLWREKCKQAKISVELKNNKPKRGRVGNMPPISSPWKATYMRHHTIEMNWRSRDVRTPKILKGHDDHVITCLQFCGNRIVSGSDDNTLKVWSASTGKCLKTLVGHTGGVWSSQMAGNIIISGSTDRTLKVWNAETGDCLHTLYGHTSTVRCMHLHGHKVVSGSRDATLRVWDINDGSCLHVLVGHLAAVRCVQYDGKLVVSGAYDYMVKIWNAERQECLHTLQGHTNRVYSLQVSTTIQFLRYFQHIKQNLLDRALKPILFNCDEDVYH